MPRRKSVSFTDAELRLMEILWRHGASTVSEVSAVLPPPPLAYNTVQTTLNILEDKGYVAREQRGRAFVYRPLVLRQDAVKSALSQFVGRFFPNSGALALQLVNDEQLSDEELDRLQAAIAARAKGKERKRR